ncbi:MAG: polyribonucleotide nucleotidyltransferase [Patescibacteria group bacterium]|nr:MAG: polyribonucleotide nucleotidyltransferase [Patescibacteria group bacterium]
MKTVKEYTIKTKPTDVVLEVGRLAPSADSAILAKQGGNCLLVTIVVGPQREGIDFVPLQVEYVEKLYAGGRIKGSRWIKREGKPSDEVVLRSRLVDRSIRPFFPKNFNYETQIIITELSVDGSHSLDFLSLLAVSAGLMISKVPFSGPIVGSEVAYIESENPQFINNPTEDEKEFSNLDLFTASNDKKVVMIESMAKEVPEDVFVKAVLSAKEYNQSLIQQLRTFAKEFGSEKMKFDDKTSEVGDELKNKYLNEVGQLVTLRLSNNEKYLSEKQRLIEKIASEHQNLEDIESVIFKLEKEFVRKSVLDDNKRVDGRNFDEIRPIQVDVSILPRTHGSGLFQRGNTQVLSVATLGAPGLEQLIESSEGQEIKRYMHHYYMPPYSVGEVGRLGSPSRREIGHGALAEKALIPVLPSEKEFPYAIRVVSEVLSSNGSTSMASVCGSTLALMDAGVPIKSMVAGIAMGLFSKSDDDYRILTDIIGLEDFSGEMDFKVAGSSEGITAVQLDVKNEGLTDEMLQKALLQAKQARLFILEKMQAVISTPRTEISSFAPKIVVIKLPEDKIGEVIGPGGKTIKSIIAKTGAEVNIDEQGRAVISGIDKESVNLASEYINNMIKEVQVGDVYDGQVVRLLPFGAIVNLFPGKDGMIHVSNLSKKFVKDPAEVVKVGDNVRVKVIKIDDLGRVNLSLVEKL